MTCTTLDHILKILWKWANTIGASNTIENRARHMSRWAENVFDQVSGRAALLTKQGQIELPLTTHAGSPRIERPFSSGQPINGRINRMHSETQLALEIA